MITQKLELLMKECSTHITQVTKEIYSILPGSGNDKAEIMVIGSTPSSKEEATGIFLEGKQKEVWESFVKEIGLSIEDFYYTYSVKYRPCKINNITGRMVSRAVTKEEMMLFSPFLLNEVEIIKPKLIITLGNQAYSVINGLDTKKGYTFGKKTIIVIEGNQYEVLSLPHPKDKSFQEMIKKEIVLETMNINKVNETNIQTIETDLGKQEIILPIKKSARPHGIRRKRKTKGKRKVMLVYGGNGLADDPTYVVAERVSMVLNELNITIKRVDLFKKNQDVGLFLDELDEVDGVILATTVKWYGIGGKMQEFLDQCWEKGRLSPFEGAYLFSIVISIQSYERDALSHMIKSWEILGGVEGVNICASIEHSADIETNNDLLEAIDKKAEDFYRIISQERIILPTSIHDNRILLKVPVNNLLGNEERELMQQIIGDEKQKEELENQKSFIGNYDDFIEQQQQDIENLAGLFKQRLASQKKTDSKTYPEIFEYKYKPDKSFADCKISWEIIDSLAESFILNFKGATLKANYGQAQGGEVSMSSKSTTLQKVVEGKISIQRAFMTGEIKAKGDFTLLYRMDRLFAF